MTAARRFIPTLRSPLAQYRDRQALVVASTDAHASSGVVALGRLIGLARFRTPIPLDALPRAWELGGRTREEWRKLAHRALAEGLLVSPGYQQRWVLTDLGRLVLDVIETP